MTLLRFPLMLLAAALTGAVLAALWYYGAKRKNALVNKVFNQSVLNAINARFSQSAARLKDGLFLAGLFLIFLALAAPQWGVEERRSAAQVSYAVLAVDVSSSMTARDLKPNRIENAKTMLKILISSLTEERIGIVAFTSKAYVQSPVTNDTAALKYFVDNLRADMLRAKGTSLYAAVETSAAMLSKYPGRKALVLLTDGEDHTPQELQSAINIAKSAGIKIVAVGLGTAQGELIPARVVNGEVADYKKDKDGKTVVTKLDEKSLQQLAEGTEGVYIKYTNFQNTAVQIAKALLDLDKETRDLRFVNGYKNRYQIPLLAGIIVILASLCIPLKKVKL